MIPKPGESWHEWGKRFLRAAAAQRDADAAATGEALRAHADQQARFAAGRRAVEAHMDTMRAGGLSLELADLLVVIAECSGDAPNVYTLPRAELLSRFTPAALKASGRPVEDGDRLRAALRPTCNGCVAAIVVVGLAWESFYVLGAMPTAARGAA